MDSTTIVTGERSASDAAQHALALPTQVGRYDLERLLGQGGMGAVYLGYDPQLDRPVAIKLLHAGGTQQRLLREARAAARIRHENVVSVFDVGEFDRPQGGAGVFMVMDFVPGKDMAVWLAEKPEPAATVEMFLQAGRGLAAAHDAGVLHRDFKASNVLIDEHGRALVLDFGLARGLSSEEIDVASDSSSRDEGLPIDMDLTDVGTVVGTPRYMSPEQHRGEPLDGRSDQYSFCLALTTALLRRYPFADDGVRAMLRDKLSGTSALSDLPLSGRARRALERGLSPKPEDRWPRMSDLLRAMKAGPFSKLVLPGVGALALGAALASAAVAAPPSSPSPCADLVPVSATHWNDDAREQLQSAYATSAPRDTTATFAASQLDRTARRLDEAQKELCELEASDAVAPDEAARRQRCLQTGAAQLGSVVERLGDPNKQATHTADMLSLLPAAGACEDATGLADDQHLRERLFSLRVLIAEHDYDSASVELPDLLRDVRAGENDGLLADVLLVASMLHQHRNDLTALMEASTEALMLAERTGREEVAVDALIARAEALGSGPSEQLPEARRAVELALAKVQRNDGSAANRLARVHYQDAILCERELFERLADATPTTCLEKARAAVASSQDGPLPDHARALNIAANLAAAAGELTEARAMIDASMTARTELAGDGHPSLILGLRVRARVAQASDDLDGARTDLARALEIAASDPKGLAQTAAFLNVELGGVLKSEGEFSAALDRYRRALPDLPAQFSLAVHTNLGFMQFLLGNYEDALTAVDETLAREKAASPRAPRVRAEMLTLRADILLRLDRTDDALDAAQRGHALVDGDENARGDLRAQALVVLASAQRRTGDVAAARVSLDEATAVLDSLPVDRVDTRARAWMEEGLLLGDPSRLRQAAAALTDDPANATIRADLEAALADLP